MTERIDLDDVETDGERDDTERRDWLNGPGGAPDPWSTGGADGRSTGSAASEPGDAAAGESADAAAGEPGDATAGESGDATAGDPGDAAATESAADSAAPLPGVPREHVDRPAGVPTDRGGSGAGATVGDAPEEAEPMGGGPHGGGVDEMTLALTYGALTRLSDPRLVVASAREWADWIGVVGDVSAPVITGFQREHAIDADFFNGTGTGPAERLADVDETSMFYAERLAVVGAPGDEWIAEEAGWEFVPLETAAEKAGWDLE